MIMLRTLLAIWTWIELGLLSMLGFLVVGSMFLLVWPFDGNRRITGRGIRCVAIAIVKLTPLWKFKIHGELPARRPSRTVCVSNHCSHTDPFLICHLPWEMKWLAKRSLFSIPFVGWGMWLAGDIAVTRGSSKSAKEAMARCARYVESGMPVIIFPEGTRSREDQLLPFKDGAFRLAISARAELLPLAVAGTASALRKGDWRASSSRGLVKVGTPISTEGMTEADVPRLKELAREKILALRRELDEELARERALKARALDDERHEEPAA
jgi:1-acyl-sn-glycerol-3-phosphate acyltransferase